jgi:hypothetical protein
MAQGLSSLLGGLAQGFTDLGKSTLDVLGGGATNNVLTAGLDALINKKSYGQAVKDANQRQKDFRKWLYETESDKDAAAKGLGTALNGAQTAIDLIPGLGQAAPVNALQGAIGGLADEFKFNGENYDWGKGAQRAAVGAGAGLAAGGLGKALANSGSKVLSNGVLKGAATGSLGGALSQAGGTAIEGGNADEILQSAAQGAQFGALLGAGTGGVQSLAGALKKERAKNGAPVIEAEEEVMASRVPDGQLGLFDQTATKTPETGYSQLGLFDQPTQPVTPKTIDVADVNPYAPVNGKVTQTMRDRAAEILNNYENGLPENELYNRIKPETMPTEGIDVLARQADGMKLKDRKAYITKNLFGDRGVEGASLDELLDVYYAGQPKYRESMRRSIENLDIAHKNTPYIKEHILKNTKDAFVKRMKQQINKAAEAPNQRGGKAGALDAALSERLGIAPGNTNKRQSKFDMEKTAYGRYRSGSKDIAVSENQLPEDALSTMAHERLHSFQFEAPQGRYDPEVGAAYRELQKDLKPLLHSTSKIRQDHYGKTDYYKSPIEQEARMLQDYLDAKGYTNTTRRGRGEYGEETHAAFDKFFDKLRELSKKGVALPAILAALGLGEYATENQEEDKDNGQQI